MVGAASDESKKFRNSIKPAKEDYNYHRPEERTSTYH